MDARPGTGETRRTGSSAHRPPLLELLERVIDTKYRPTQEELEVLVKTKRSVLTGYSAGTLLGGLPGVLAYRFWRPQSPVQKYASLFAAFAGFTYGGKLGGYWLSRTNYLKPLLELEGSRLQGELVAILREQDPNHPALALLKAKEQSGAVMYDERGEVAYPRLRSEAAEGAFPNASFQQTESDTKSSGEQARSGYKERMDSMRERVRADLERRREKSGAPSRNRGPGDSSVEGMKAETGWGDESSQRSQEREGQSNTPFWQPAQPRAEATGDTFFVEPMDIAMGSSPEPLAAPEVIPEHHKRLSHMSRQERRDYLRHRELAARSRADSEGRTDHQPVGLVPESSSSQTGARMHTPPPVRL